MDAFHMLRSRHYATIKCHHLGFTEEILVNGRCGIYCKEIIYI